VAFFMGVAVGYLAVGSVAWWQWSLAATLLVLALLASFLLRAGLGHLADLADFCRSKLPSLAFLLVLASLLLGLLKSQPGVLIGHFERDWSLTRMLFFLLVPFLVGLLAAFALVGNRTRGPSLLTGLLAWCGTALIIVLVSRATILAERQVVGGSGEVDLVLDLVAGMGIGLTVLAAIGGLVLASLGALGSWWLARWRARAASRHMNPHGKVR
jgi:hypothetical protein